MTEESATPFGRYRLIREIGRGGEAIVHLALDAMLHRRVALKVFPRVVVADASPPGFRAEVEALARVRHPGICEVHDAGIEDGSPYIAMSYVEGQSLAEVGRVSAREASRLGADVADVIAAAHAQGVIHGDVKPENVVLTTQGRCVVLDFGVARLLDEAGTPGTARIGGTLPYVAPERLDGVCDARGDVYGIAGLVFALVSGRPPRVAATRAALLHDLKSGEAPLLRDVVPGASRDLEAVLARSLARDPDRRHASAGALGADLARIARGERPALARLGACAVLLRWVRRHPAAAALAVFLVAFLVIATLVATIKNRELASRLAEVRVQEHRAHEAAATARAHLERFERLADRRRIAELEARAATLLPPRPEIAKSLEAWLDEAQSVASRLLAHRADLAASNAVVEPWHAAQLAALVADLERFVDPDRTRGTIADVRARISEIVAMQAGLLESAARWAEARQSIADAAASPRHGGLRLAPQLGLRPLRRDAVTGLWEFLHEGSGTAPRPSDDGGYEIDGESGIVLVLIPGGIARVGATFSAGGAERSGSFVDPMAAPSESPVMEVALDPFFIAKYEMTRGQWERIRGARGDAGGGAALPVREVSWAEADAVLRRAGLELPTEAQWEYCARAGTATPWWTGDQAESLDGAAVFKTRGPSPVGRLRPNAFGLHDVAGNVAEWVRDRYARYGGPLSAGTGEAMGQGAPDLRIRRGGGWLHGPRQLRSSDRIPEPASARPVDTGVRPSRRLDR